MRRTSTLRSVLVALGTCALAGCATRPHAGGSWSFTTSVATFYGYDMAEARALADDAAALLPEVERVLGRRASRGPLIITTLPEDEFTTRATGATWRRRFPKDIAFVQVSRELDPVQRRAVLAHELTHFVLDRELAPLPPAIEEGLCEVVADDLVPEARVAAAHLLKVAFLGRRPALLLRDDPAVPGAPRLRAGLPLFREALSDEGPRVILEMDRDEAGGRDYALGYLIVRRIGRDHGFVWALSALCHRARAAGHDVAPAEWFLAAAKLHDDDDALRLANEALDALDDEMRARCVDEILGDSAAAGRSLREYLAKQIAPADLAAQRMVVEFPDGRTVPLERAPRLHALLCGAEAPIGGEAMARDRSASSGSY